MRSIHHGEEVLGRDGSRLGRVDRIVVDEGARRVTHIVVADRAIPLERVTDGGDRLATDLEPGELDRLQDASQPPFAAPGENWEPPTGYRLEQFMALVGNFARAVGPGPFQPPVHIETGASDIHEITDGSPVWCGDREVGHVDRLLLDGSGGVAAVVVRSGLRGRLRAVPVDRVAEVVANNVHLTLTDAEFDSLPGFDLNS